MSVNINGQGIVRRLDRIPESPVPVTERDAANLSWLARTLVGLLQDVARILGRWAPRRIDFEDRVVGSDGVYVDGAIDPGATTYRFNHNFSSRVRWWVVDWVGEFAPALRKHETTPDDVLVLTSTSAGTMTLRIEEAG